MFGFGSKTKKLEKKYAQLLEEAFQLSTSNRAKSDEKTAEAEKSPHPAGGSKGNRIGSG